jgi:hypothetical protein
MDDIGNRFDAIRRFAHSNFVAHDDIWMRFDMMVDHLRTETLERLQIVGDK